MWESKKFYHSQDALRTLEIAAAGQIWNSSLIESKQPAKKILKGKDIIQTYGQPGDDPRYFKCPDLPHAFNFACVAPRKGAKPGGKFN